MWVWIKTGAEPLISTLGLRRAPLPSGIHEIVGSTTSFAFVMYQDPY